MSLAELAALYTMQVFGLAREYNQEYGTRHFKPHVVAVRGEDFPKDSFDEDMGRWNYDAPKAAFAVESENVIVVNADAVGVESCAVLKHELAHIIAQREGFYDHEEHGKGFDEVFGRVDSLGGCDT